MPKWVLVFYLFWVCIGVAIMRNEVEAGNKKFLTMSFYSCLKVVGKAAFYGPFTKAKMASILKKEGD